MTNPPSPLAAPMPWDLVARDYAEVTAPFFEKYAQAALERAAPHPGAHIVDVACGPGTLALLAARRGYAVTAVDFAPSMIDQLRVRAAALGVDTLSVVADGQALPFDDEQFDAAFSMFGVMFYPDRLQGMREMYRTLVPGGAVVISSWQPMDRFPLLSDVFAALQDLLPGMPFSQGKAPLGEPEEFSAELSAAGFESVRVREVSASIETPSLDAAWEHLHRGSAPFALLRSNLGEASWQDMEVGLLRTLRDKYGPGRQTLTMRANLGVGLRPRA